MSNVQKDIQIKIKNATGWDELFPKTKATLVSLDSGNTVEKVIGNLLTDLATKQTGADVDARIQTLVGAAPAALDTLVEIAAALNNDSDFAGTMTTELAKKANKDVATAVLDGLMSMADKTKLDGIEEGANNYVHPVNHPASVITQDASNRFVTDTEKTAWNSKVDSVVGKALSEEDFTTILKTKLDGVEEGATKYVHPDNHDASMITESATKRFVTDTEKTAWNSKSNLTVSDTLAAPVDAKGDLWYEVLA